MGSHKYLQLRLPINFKSLSYTPDDALSDAKTYSCFEWSFVVSVNSGQNEMNPLKQMISVARR